MYSALEPCKPLGRAPHARGVVRPCILLAPSVVSGQWRRRPCSGAPRHIPEQQRLVPSARASATSFFDEPSKAITHTQAARPATYNYNGVFLLLLVNVVFFFLDHTLHLRVMQDLYLNHAHPHWWQFVTHSFCHGNFNHLSSNLFNLCIFGKLVEETEGAGGLWAIYILTAVGAALASFLLSPAVVKGCVTVSVGASGAIFGLFAVAVLTRLRLDLRHLLEAAILGNFVWHQLLSEARHQAAGGLVVGGMPVSHLAHLGGALAGVMLVLLLSKLPEQGGA